MSANMNFTLNDLRRTLSRWRTEHGQAAHDASAVNLRRGQVLCPMISGINAIGATVLAFQLAGGANGVTAQWKWALLMAHLAMTFGMGVFGFLTYKMRHAHRDALTVWLIRGGVVFGMGIAITIVAVDQWVTPNITAFILPCVLIGLAVYLRPVEAAVIYGMSYLAFYLAIGVTQANPEQLLSNRLNGFVACAMGWALSVLLWRKFITIALQQAQLEKVNAELQSKQRDLERLTRLDGLTGLYNRRTFVELTELELVRAQRQGSATAILLLDLDHFKRVNDTWGHPAGDAVLKNVASVVSKSVRSTDLVGRLGGEEFIILLPGTSVLAARKLAEKVRARLEANPTLFEQTTIRTTASIGLAGTTAAEKRAFDQLYNDADKALYAAKQRGRNQVV
jgi:diguanylate cyclase (GGDEF)-like protein